MQSTTWVQRQINSNSLIFEPPTCVAACAAKFWSPRQTLTPRFYEKLAALLLYFSLFTYTNKKGGDWKTGLELSLTGQIKITHNISGCPGQFGTVGNPTCTYVITYLSVLTLAITSASSRCMHRLSTFPVINNDYTWTYLKVMHGHHLAVSLSFFCLRLTPVVFLRPFSKS